MQSLKTNRLNLQHTEGGYFSLKNLFFIAFLCLSNLLSAQNSEVPFVHLDRPFYVVGDDVWFKIYLVGNANQNSSIVQIEIVAPNGTTYLKQNIKTKDHMAVGDFNVPLSWEEGNYLFRVYTLWQTDSLSAPQAIISDAIVPIYNDLIPQKKLAAQIETSIADAVSNNNNTYKVEWANNNNLARREKKNLRLKLTNANGQPLTAQVSVSIFENISGTNADLNNNEQQVLKQLQVNQNAELKPITSLLLSGTVKDPLSNSLVSDRYLSLYTPATGTFTRVASKEGVFKTALPEFCGDAPVQLLSLNPNRSYPMDVTLNAAANLPIYSNNAAPVRSKAIDNYLKNNQLRRQSNDIFGIASRNLDTTTCVRKTVVYDAEKSYEPKSFYNLTTFAEFVREVLLNVSVEKNERGRTLRLGTADETKPYMFAPWYMVNGLFIDAEEPIMNIPFNEFKSVEIFNRRKQIEKQFDNLMFRYGVLRLELNNNPRYLKQLDFKYKNVAGFAAQRTFTPPLSI
jgi:hypothetical protein